MNKVSLKASKTAKYAQKDPSLPHTFVLKDKTYSLEQTIANRIVKLGGGEILGTEVEQKPVGDIEPKAEKTVEPVEPQAPVEPEPAKPEAAPADKYQGNNKRKPGQRSNR